MRATNKTVRHSISLPEKIAAQLNNLAKARRVSANRILVELIENGIDSEERNQQEFVELPERFRSATDPKEAKRLGDHLGRMFFSR
jgi:predicted DNA-binding protein